MPTIFIYSPIFNAPVTARTRLAPTRRYARYAETVTYSVPVRDSAAHCVRCGMMVDQAKTKGEYWRQEAQCVYVVRCMPPIFHSLFVATHTSFRHTPSRPWSRTTATVWRNLEQDPRRGETFTFSAKEKDLETGFSYFGSRYYNSDLSIWLSVDPMSDKYPSLSPYVYCANNPIVIKDPNGMDYNPVFSTEGKLLGTDKDGWVGTPVVMKEEQFEQGMDRHVGTEFEIGVPLDQYENGISISNNDWNKIEKEGGNKRLIPYVENKSSHDIFYKPEESSKALSIRPGKDLYAPVDGIAAPHLHKGMVYKITDGIHVSVTNNGVDITKVSGPKYRFGMSLFGGWKDESWHYSLTTDRFLIFNLCDQQPYYMYKTPDHGWDDLFSKSR